MRKLTILGLLALAAAAACGDDQGTTVTEIDAEGAVAGLVWLDRNGNGLFDSSDAPIGDVVVRFFAGPGPEPAFTATSLASGQFTSLGVPVGDYGVRVDSASAGDSVRVLTIDSATLTVARDDTTSFTIGFTYPTLPVDTARAELLNTRLFVEGRALNGWATFADSTVHVRDATGAIRAVRLPPNPVSAGDSVRVQGTLSLRAGQPVVRNGPLFVLGTGVESPPPDTVTALTAATANAGQLDADLVHLDSVVIQDTTINALGEVVMTVQDGSGTVDVLLDRDIPFSLSFNTEIVGTILDVTGLLVPQPSGGSWRIKPRSNADLVIGPLSYPTLTVASARAEPVDTRIQVIGRALNRWNAFGDSIVHLRDATGSIRAVRIQPVSVAAGDSVRFVGTTARLAAQTVLRDVRTRILEKGLESPTPDTVTAAVAVQAQGGALDAGLVRLDSVVIRDTLRNAAGERVFLVEDGTASVRVVLDQDVPFVLAFPSDVIGTILEVQGLLVPRGTASEWVVKPRTSSDVVVGDLSYPRLPVDTARQRPPETRLIVRGRALTGWNTFNDSTLHIADATGAIRALRVAPVAIANGDSIEIVGTTTVARGQPVLRDTRISLLQTGVASPPADSIATATAANAGTGTRDAALVRIAGATVQDTTRNADGDFVLEADDGSGTVDVVLDLAIPFFFNPGTIVGSTIEATGVLVPSLTTTGVWVLKPRRNSDLVVN